MACRLFSVSKYVRQPFIPSLMTIFITITIFSYYYLVYKKKYLIIIDEYKNINLAQRKKITLLYIAYVIFLIFIAFIEYKYFTLLTNTTDEL